jgi:hypothetical protein
MAMAVGMAIGNGGGEIRAATGACAADHESGGGGGGKESQQATMAVSLPAIMSLHPWSLALCDGGAFFFSGRDWPRLNLNCSGGSVQR